MKSVSKIIQKAAQMSCWLIATTQSSFVLYVFVRMKYMALDIVCMCRVLLEKTDCLACQAARERRDR